jgi:hypothetical protein
VIPSGGALIIVIPTVGRITCAYVGGTLEDADAAREMVGADPRLAAVADLMAELRDEAGDAR